MHRFFYGWTIVVVLGVTTIISYGTSQYFFGVLVEPIARDLGWNKAEIGAGYSGMLLVSGGAGLALGHVLDRFGARLLMSLGSLMSGIALLLVARMQTLPEFYFLWSVGMGVGTALTFYPVSFTVVANWFYIGRARALSLLTFMGAFASTIFYPLAGFLVSACGWREAVLILSASQLLVALPLHATVVRRHPEDLGLHPDGALPRGLAPTTSGIAFWRALRSRPFWLLTLAIGLSFFASTIVLVEQIAYLISRGYRPAFAASLIGFFGIAYLPGRSIVMYAAGRVSLRIQLACALGAAALGVAMLSFAPTNPALVLAYIGMFGAAYGAFAPLRGAIMAEYFGRRSYGAIIAAQGVPVAVLAAFGPIVAGKLIDSWGYGTAFQACMGALSIAAVIVLIPQRSAGGSPLIND